MPKNPFGQDDPLGGGGGGAWGAGAGQGAGGFGDNAGRGAESYAVDGDEYDVVDIAEPGASAPAAGKAKKSGNGFAASFNISGGKGATSGAGSKDVSAREAALNKREADLARREAQLREGSTRASQGINNWPPCLPLVHHDISKDVPEGKRGITRAGFFIFLLTITTLTYNLVAVVITSIAADVGNVASSIIFAIIYFLIGIPGAWIMWYKRLYRAMIFDGAASFATFFFSFMIHIVFSIYSAIAPSLGGNAPSANAHAGFLTALDIIRGEGGGNKLGGILFFFGCGLWAFLAFLSILYLSRVYKFFRTSGAEDRARQQATSAATRHAIETF